MKHLLLPFVALFSLLSAACSPTTINAVWKDPAYTTTPKKVFVVAVLKNETNRRVLEDEFVRQLKQKGVEGIAAYQAFGGKEPENKDLVIAMVKESGADAVLVSRILDKRTEQRSVPGTAYTTADAYYRSWPGYYGAAYTTTYYTPGYTVTDQFAIAETNLFNVANEGLAWTVSTETWLDNTPVSLLKGYATTVINAMQDDNLLK